MQTPAHLLRHDRALAAPDAPPEIQIHPHVAEWPWRFEVYHPGLSAVLPAVQAFCSAVIRREPPKRWLSLLGPSGVGKTHVLKQALACLQSAATRGLWKIPTPTGQRSPQLAHLIPTLDLTDYRAPQDYARYDLIYIEDIGSGAALDHRGAGAVTRSRIAELLQLRSQRWTLLDANLYRREIERQLDGRIASRLKRDGSWMVEVPQEVGDFWDR
ncbi:hypothetical protein [Prosthecobacter sp.]|uniref:hypothetical protein n=1 Tax=Prosthecobacter sp. TaxID=1965333 RepID=UPI003782F29A